MKMRILWSVCGSKPYGFAVIKCIRLDDSNTTSFYFSKTDETSFDESKRSKSIAKGPCFCSEFVSLTSSGVICVTIQYQYLSNESVKVIKVGISRDVVTKLSTKSRSYTSQKPFNIFQLDRYQKAGLGRLCVQMFSDLLDNFYRTSCIGEVIYETYRITIFIVKYSTFLKFA